MMSVIFNLFVVTFFVCLFVQDGLSIKCFDCKTTLLDTTADVACRDKFGKSLTRECESSVCSIAVKTLDNGEGSITRGCGSHSNGTVVGEEITSADRGQYSDDEAHVSWSTCSTDLCNSDVAHDLRIRRQIDEFFHYVPHTDRPVIHRNNRNINCYSCLPKLFDEDDKIKCAMGKDMEVEACLFGACKIFKFSFNGDEVVARGCDDPSLDWFATQLPKYKDFKNDKLSLFGAELSWSTCYTDLCNWGVMNRYQTMTLFFSVMLPLSVYCTLF